MALAVLALVSALTAAGVLWIVRVTSDQQRIRDVRRSIRAGLFEIRLFNDDPGAMLRAQREILASNIVYLRLSLVPVLWALLPIALLAAQLQFWYGYTGLRPGASALVTATLLAGAADPGALRLETPDGVQVDTPPVWIPSLGEATWRVTAHRPGDYDIRLSAGGEPAVKSLRVDGGYARLSPVRLAAGVLSQILYSAESALPAATRLQSIAVTYPTRWIQVFGIRLHWLTLFTVLTLFFALVLRRTFGVVL